MSNSTYAELWKETQRNVADILILDPEDGPLIPDKDSKEAFQFIATLYIKYIQILRKLDICYDQIIHPQKRITIRFMLDATLGRLLELKEDLVNIDASEYHFFDDILSDLKLLPSDIEIPIPRYFLFERAIELQERERAIDDIYEQLGIDFGLEYVPSLPSLQDAIRLIQRHERARQGRLRARIMHAIRQQDVTAERKAAPMLTPKNIALAAICIQKMWKAFQQKQMVRKRREEEMLFLGMKDIVKPADYVNPVFYIRQLGEAQKRAIQEAHEYDFQDALVKIKENILDVEGAEMQESMQDKIRQWIIDMMYALGKVPEYPEEEIGGSMLILEDKLGLDEYEKLERDREKTDKTSASKKGKKDETTATAMQLSRFVPTISQQYQIYKETWETKDESNNIAQKHDEEIIKAEKRVEVREELRALVDNLMEIELDRLREALARDQGKKAPPKKKPPKKKGAKAAKKAKKKEKDLTPDRTLESLFEELVTEGIIKKFPKVSLSEYIGEYCYLGSILKKAKKPVLPSLSDVRRLIAQYCIIPLGSQVVHMEAPNIKSVLLVGPSGSGKTMLVNAICTEAGATLFDLSPHNIVDKYPGKDGLKMLMHLVYKVGKLLEPSVVLIKNAELMLQKKLSKEEKALDPKRIKAAIPKLLKALTEEERILLIATTSRPYNSDPKAIGKLYNKTIMIPKPDYACRFLLWKTFLRRFIGKELPHVNISALTHISDGYSAGSILRACKEVLTDHRIALQHRKVIRTQEFITPLSRMEPLYIEEESAIESWYLKTPLGRRWQIMMEE